jgi:SAM-dependent methyltransferase
MKSSDHIREQVSYAYARAVSRPVKTAGPCCSPVQKGVVVKLAGYGADELAALPDEAVVNSFGCGNPLAFSEVREGETVLDLGSGAGIDLLLAARKVGQSGKVIGVDMTDAMIAKAKNNIAAAGLSNIEVRKGLIESLPVESDSVDWVISNCVINLSPEKSRVFAEIARVLRPGGRMLVSDIVVEELPDWVRRDVALYASCVSGAISEAEYLDGLRRAGLVDVEVRERIVYDEAQLAAFTGSELSEVLEGGACCGGSAASSERLAEVARGLAGKIWSAKFFARKKDEASAN